MARQAHPPPRNRAAAGHSTPRIPYFLPQLLANPEDRHPLGRNLYRFAGSGIAPPPGPPAPRNKTPETPQFHFVPVPQGLGNARHEKLDDAISLPAGKAEPVGNSRNQF